ncbi:hypothetical protein FA95DRAFT_1484931 [Auriscalpium vulgare]|uniref:Uncharacterized protein n=1 Tax=Auriscalpium vulgare TaxID=40419 RepID=A0ACB8S7H9_9AGAM|nr:hypothetical protein FA95DRAFT_1484931 [Auriscalpium vulgare]
MAKVLAHLTARCIGLNVLTLLFPVLLALPPAAAQYLVNGQVFTNALAIVDAPAPQSTFHAGSDIPIALDISGNGKLPQAAATPGAGLATGFDLLELYLISTQAKLNLTISNGTGLLTQEPGSTVKHLDFALPNCVAAGAYNFTVYETSHINNEDFFSITPIPISIENTNFNGPCTDGVNALQSLPQPDSPPAQQPFLNATATPLDTSSHSGTIPVSGSIPVTVPSPLPTPNATQVITLTIGPSGVPLPFPTATPPPGTVTLLLVTVDTVTTTAQGQTTGFTTVYVLADSSTSMKRKTDVAPVSEALLLSLRRHCCRQLSVIRGYFL